MDIKIGKIFVVSSPSGGGKDLIVSSVLSKLKSRLIRVPTFTTRSIRKGESEGVEYFFISEQEFKKKVGSGEIFEYNLFSDNYYGSSKDKINEAIMEGKNIILIIDVHGAKAVKKYFPEAILIFIYTSLINLKKRLIDRGKNSPEDIERRLKIAKEEYKEQKYFDFVVENIQDRPELAINEVLRIINKSFNV